MEAQERVDERRLPGAVGAEQADRPPRESGRQPLEDGAPTEANAQPFELDRPRDHHCAVAPPACRAWSSACPSAPSPWADMIEPSIDPRPASPREFTTMRSSSAYAVRRRGRLSSAIVSSAFMSSVARAPETLEASGPTVGPRCSQTNADRFTWPSAGRGAPNSLDRRSV